MTPLRGTFLLAGLATVGAVLGGVAGATIGFVAPGYYQAIFEDRLNPVIDPIQMGVGLGAGQGAGAGLIVGVLLVAFLAWKSVRGENSDISAGPSNNPPWVLVTAKRFLFGVALLFVGFVSFVAGAVVGQTDIYNRRAADETRAIAERLELEAHAGRFEGIVYGRRSLGHAMLSGQVNEPADLDLLIEELRDLFGTDMAIEMARGVEVVRASPSDQQE